MAYYATPQEQFPIFQSNSDSAVQAAESIPFELHFVVGVHTVS